MDMSDCLLYLKLQVQFLLRLYSLKTGYTDVEVSKAASPHSLPPVRSAARLLLQIEFDSFQIPWDKFPRSLDGEFGEREKTKPLVMERKDPDCCLWDDECLRFSQ